MKKPKLHVKHYYDYHECADYIADKMGFDLNDVDGKYNYKNRKKMDKIECKDFWHFLLNCKGDIRNGCMINIPEKDKMYEDWQNQICQAFHDEFGIDAEYWIEW